VRVLAAHRPQAAPLTSSEHRRREDKYASPDGRTDQRTELDSTSHSHFLHRIGQQSN
jgi:hypothetical protein